MDPQNDMSWSRTTSEVPIVPDLSEEDFSQLFDLGDAGLSEFEPNGAGDATFATQNKSDFSTQDTSGFDESALRHYFNVAPELSSNEQPHGSRNFESLQSGRTMHHNAGIPKGYIPQTHIPPTPNSTEIFASLQGFEHFQMAPPGFVNNGHYQPNRVSTKPFTPTMTPEFNGIDTTSSSIPHFPITDGYSLSPITSPAIHPQNNAPSGASSLSRTADSSLTASPVELNNDFDVDGFQDRPRKSRRKGASNQSANTPRQRKQSIAGNQKRRANSSIQVNTKVGAMKTQFSSNDVYNQTLLADSESRSMSPKADVSMAPPPKPITPATTPMTTPRANGFNPLLEQQSKSNLPPATPASIMRLQKENGPAGFVDPQQTPQVDTLSPATSALDSQMEFLKLPEAAASPPNENTPQTARAEASKKASRPGSAVVSPSGPVGKDPEARQGRPPKKRGSNSNLVSPALRPKISPGLKPLLPEGASFSPQDHALLLATRSNYQNLLDGTNPPGVTYSTDLSSGLSSKRASHKLAEQGRRNRINTALQEMQSLLPPAFTNSTIKDSSSSSSNGNSKDAEGSTNGTIGTPQTPAQSGNSKAATVECAIEYIKHLHQDRAERDAENERLKKELLHLQSANVK